MISESGGGNYGIGGGELVGRRLDDRRELGVGNGDMGEGTRNLSWR